MAASNNGLIWAVLLFAVFAILGTALLYPLGLRPFLRISAARQWRETPCVIDSSRVEKHVNNDENGQTETYSVAVNYHYTINDVTHTSDRYDFAVGSTGEYASKLAIVASLPPGAHATCFVNPNDPNDAVINRGFTSGLWIAVVPAVFLLVGFGGLIGCWIWRRA